MMNPVSSDIQYATLQLGVDEITSLAQVQSLLINARAYRFSTRDRIKHIERFATFFIERNKLGEPQDSFETIRKAYHREAMALHPDRNHGDPQAEEQLKAFNSAYEIIEAVHKEARAYFKFAEAEQQKIATEARLATERETPATETAKPRTVHMSYEEAGANPDNRPRAYPHPPGLHKYMAASIPRFIRNARLFYLDRENIIGSKLFGSPAMLYDIIMLSEREFKRARLRLSMEGYGVQELTMSKLTPPYIPRDVKEVLIPTDELDPEGFARAYFWKAFKL